MSEELSDFFKLISEDKKKKKENFNEMVGDLGLDSLFNDIAVEKKRIREEKEKQLAKKVEEEKKQKDKFDKIVGEIDVESLFEDLSKIKKESKEEQLAEENRQKKVLTSFENFLTTKIDDIEETKEEIIEEVKDEVVEEVEVESEPEVPTFVEKSLDILNEVSDPLTPPDQNFATLQDLQDHYRKFLVRIQQQLSSLGGGGIEDAPKTGGPYVRQGQKWVVSSGGGIGTDGSVNTTGIITASSFSGNNLNVTGITTLASAGGITTTGGDLYVGGDLFVLDDIVYDEVDGRNLNISGVTTVGTILDVNGTLNVSGISTFQSDVRITDDDKLRFGTSGGGTLQVYTNGTNSFFKQTSGDLKYELADQFIVQKDSGDEPIAKFNADADVELYYDGSKKLETTGIGISVFNGSGDTATIAGPGTLIIDPAIVGDNTGILRIKGDLFVDGTTTQINSTTIEFADFVVGVATTATTNLLTDGAGIGIGSDKTFLYEFNSGSNPSLKSSENLNVASGKVYQIAETERLSADTLSVGTGATVHSPASNTLTLGTAGTERLRITSDGSVGIGTTSAEFKVTVYDAGYTGVTIKSNRTTATDNIGGLHFKTQNTNVAYIQSLVDGTIKVRNSSSLTERVRITSSGLVGIGTDSPVSPIHIVGTNGIKIDDSTNGKRADFRSKNDIIEINGYDPSNSNAAVPIVLKQYTNERLRIDSNGNVGIGTDSPQERLHVARIVMVTGNTPQIRLNANDSDASDNDRTMLGQATAAGNFVTTAVDNDTILRGTSTGNLLFGVGTAEKFRITSDGKFGFGTNNPQGTVHISSGTSGDATLILEADTDNNWEGDNPYIVFRQDGGISASAIGHGVDSGVDGNALTIANSISSGFISFATGSTNGYTNATERLRITSDGKIGIGTNSPAYDLDLGKSNSTIRLVAGNNGTALRVGAGGGGNDVTLIRVDGSSQGNNYNGESDSGQYGFSLKYLGSGSQNANAFAIFSDNQQAGTQVQAFTVFQDGTVGINSTSPSERLDVGGTIKTEQLNVTGDLSIADKIVHTGDTNTSISFPSTDYIRLTTAGSSRLNATPNGYILLGTTSEPSGGDAHSRNARLLIHGRIANSSDSGRLNLQRGSAAAFNGSSIGSITFTDSSNNAFARIESLCDGTPGTDDYPGRIVFSTTPDGSTAPTENFRISSDGTSTFSGHVHLGDDDELRFGAGNDFKIVHDPNDCRFENSNGDIKFKNTGSYFFFDEDGGETLASFINDGAVNLYHNNSKKFETVGTGVTVYGDAYIGSDNSSGVILTSPNGTKYRLIVANDGTLSTTSV